MFSGSQIVFHKEKHAMLKWQPIDKVVSVTSLRVFYKQPITNIFITIFFREIKKDQK